jgi:carboxyl-terminal processing protease
MRRIPWTRLAVLTLLLGVVAGCARPAAPPAPAYDRATGLATFERAWQIVYDTHFDTTFNGVDWLALREELRPQAEGATSTAALRRTIERMLERLQQSHFSLIPKEFADTLVPAEDEDVVTGDVGLDVRLLGEELVVTQVEPDSPADSAGIDLGWVLVAVDGDSIGRLLAGIRARDLRYPDGFLLWATTNRRVDGAVGAPVTLKFRDRDDRPQERTLTRRPAPSEPVKFGNLPTFFARFARDTHTTPGGHRVGRIWFNFWMPPLIRQVDAAIDAYRAFDGVVVDLRGNRGGAGGMVLGVAGHFLTERVSLGDFRYRTTTLHMRANPRLVDQRNQRVEPFGGPLAVLIDETSGSASEVFAGGMQAIGRARVFGSPSLGGVLPAVTDRLPNGDVLYHAVADFITADGVVLEGRGVIPDVSVRPTRDDLLAGHDPVLDAALAWIDTQTEK